MIYFDNAASSPMMEEAITTMNNVAVKYFGNPSSIHKFGREARYVIEDSRKIIAGLLNIKPHEIVFTSGGTEANNMIINSVVENLGIKHIITTQTEHLSVLNCVKHLAEKNDVVLHFADIDNNGNVIEESLEKLLKETDRALVCLRHACNETGNLLRIKDVSELVNTHNSLFFSDMVQTIGKYRNNLQAFNVDFASASAHKFHGPKGVGFAYINEKVKIESFIKGGHQERGLRAGTENIAGIAAMAKALEIGLKNIDEDIKNILVLKNKCIDLLKENINGVVFNGDSEKGGLYSIINIGIPKTNKNQMLVNNLDINGVAVSSGSACGSGANKESHVIQALGRDKNFVNIRISFSKYNTTEEVDRFVNVLKQYC